jgi:hypothetical protein
MDYACRLLDLMLASLKPHHTGIEPMAFNASQWNISRKWQMANEVKVVTG